MLHVNCGASGQRREASSWLSSPSPGPPWPWAPLSRFCGLRRWLEPGSPGQQPCKGSQLSSGSPCTNALNQFGPDRCLALVPLDYPQSHSLRLVPMMPFYKFKTNISCLVPRPLGRITWRLSLSFFSSPHPCQAPDQDVIGEDT